MSIKRMSSILFALRLIRMFVNVLSAMVSAKFFGISMERDAWILALTITTAICSAIWGPVNETFRTKFVYLKEIDGTRTSIDKTASLVGFITTITIILCTVLLFNIDNLSALIIVRTDTGFISIFSKLLVCILPTLLINQLSNISISILNAFDIFYIPEIVGTITSIVSVGLVYCLAPCIGIYSLVLSNYFGIISLFCVLLYYLNKMQINIWNKLFYYNIKDAWKFIVFSLPLFLPYLLGQSNSFFEKYLSSKLGVGFISSVEYARQFSVILQSVVNSVLTTLMVPMLSKAFITNNKQSFTHILKENFLTIFFIVGLALFYMVGSADAMCNFLFNKGNIDSNGLKIIIQLTQMYGVAFIGVVLYVIIGLALLASNKRKEYAFIGVFTQIIVLLLNYLLIDSIGVYTFPLNYGFAHFITSIFMWGVLRIEDKKNLSILILRCIIVILLIAIIILFINTQLAIKNDFVALVVSSLIILVLSPFFAYGLGFNIIPFIKKHTKWI